MKSTIYLPRMLFGTLHQVERDVEQLASQCARQLATGDSSLPSIPVREVSTGSIIYTNFNTDLDSDAERWRWYVVRKYFSVFASDSGTSRDSLGSRCGLYESTWWGAFIALIGHHAPNSISRIASLLKVVIDSWSQLAALKYVDKTHAPIDLETILNDHLSGLFVMWIDHSIRDTKRAIEEVIERGMSATREEILERLTRVAVRLSESVADLEQRASLSDTAFIRERLSRLPETRFMELSGGFTGSLRRELKFLAR